MTLARAAAAVLLTGGLVATLGGCAPIVPLDPAADANNPGCADVIVRLPDTVGDLSRRETNAQATGAWGSPASVLLYCGVEVPSASSTDCISVDGVFWLVDGDDAPTYILTSYGREPAIDLVIDTATVASTPVLMDLARAVSFTTPNGHECTDAEEVDSDSGLGGGTGTN